MNNTYKVTTRNDEETYNSIRLIVPGLHRKPVSTEHCTRYTAICIQTARTDTEVRNVFPRKAGFNLSVLGNRTQPEMAIGKLYHGI